ncbi:glycerate kinase [Duganella qianjiadongensis]|uniref:Glycerate kinase n=1 Tax=Duganella qianjiadongensis TaxID=2692176 RepID=A0ABW9VL18_9BURK|nr:glycerate kinase [Duganella qianjiadongensis]MYM39751.1 glycerate kinase [Duganella qianjiadongensis]
MKIVIAPDSFKESLSALEVASAIEAGFREIYPAADYHKLPMADGGEGTVQALIDASGGQRIERTVAGPLGQPVQGFYGLMGDGCTAVIEMAAASGLELLAPQQRDALHASTYGTGQLIRAALDAGARHFILGVGGSATNDGGAGMLQALGARLLAADGQELPGGGAALAQLDQIELSGFDARLAQSSFQIACDVDNPLVGPHGASVIFGPQKGATPEQVLQLDSALRHYAAVLERQFGQQVAHLPGAGAGGGIGAAMLVFLRGSLRPGSDIVAQAVGLAEAIADADLVLTGEGRVDGQTVHGKTPIGVARLAQRYGKPVVVIGGCLGSGVELVYQHGIAASVAAVSRPCTVAQALAEAQQNVRLAARNVAALLKLGQGL